MLLGSWFRVIAGVFLCLAGLAALSQEALAGIHSSPIVFKGLRVSQITRFPIANYRVFRTGKNGEAVPIPFQIDETNEWGDYVLDQGPNPNVREGNGIFDLQDELAIMGDDVGPAKAPTSWPQGKPIILHEIKFRFPDAKSMKNPQGAVYVGIYFSNPPPLVTQRYVIFDPKAGRITTSRYRYDFDKQNYLVLHDVSMLENGSTPENPKLVPVIDSSTFYLEADMKYFLTMTANHRSINSKLDAYKAGPVRTIVRVTFFYTILKLNFEVGMYTEVSFFSNSVILPAIIYNPINGKTSLNKGSGFYYGFSLYESPDSYEFATNMRPYRAPKNPLLDFFQQQPKPESKYWLSALGKDRMLYVELRPSDKMLKDDNIPTLYRKNVTAADLAGIDNNKILPLEQGKVNVALYFDLTKFDKGEHNMAFQLFFDNKRDERELESFKRMSEWIFEVSRQ